MTIWFTVQLADRPGSLAQVANALAERSVNITGIVGVAEDPHQLVEGAGMVWRRSTMAECCVLRKSRYIRRAISPSPVFTVTQRRSLKRCMRFSQVHAGNSKFRRPTSI